MKYVVTFTERLNGEAVDRLDDPHECESFEDAKAFQTLWNSFNKEDTYPYWAIHAEDPVPMN